MATKKENPFAKKKKAPSKSSDKESYDKGSGNNLPKDMMGKMASCMKKGKSMKQCRKEAGG